MGWIIKLLIRYCMLFRSAWTFLFPNKFKTSGHNRANLVQLCGDSQQEIHVMVDLQ